MKHAWLAATAALLLLSTPADARTRCRPAALPEPEAAAEDDRWPHDASDDWVHDADASWANRADASWVHENASGRWVHENARYDAKEGAGWVHETDYGWWAAVPDADLSDLTGEDEEGVPAEDAPEDCRRDRGRNECVALFNQIAGFKFRLELAIDREDEVWEASLRERIERLEARGERYGCPWVEPSLRVKIEQTVEAVARAVGVAAQVAAMLYRMGLM